MLVFCYLLLSDLSLIFVFMAMKEEEEEEENREREDATRLIDHDHATHYSQPTYFLSRYYNLLLPFIGEFKDCWYKGWGEGGGGGGRAGGRGGNAD